MHALLYRRVSTGGQENSLAAQESGNLLLCQQQGWTHTAIDDPDTSGGLPLAERAGGAALLAALRDCNPATTVLVTAKQDRLGRDNLDIVHTVRFIWDAGIVPWFALEGGAFPRTPENELLLGIKAAVSNYELNMIRDRIHTVLQHKRHTGQLFGTVPFGWNAEYEFADGHLHTSPIALFWGGKRGKGGDGVMVDGKLVGGVHPPEPEAAALLAAHGQCVAKRLVPHATEQWWLRHLVARRYPAWPDTSHKALPLRACAALLNGAGLRPKAGAAQWTNGTVNNLFTSQATRELLAQPPSEPGEPGEDGGWKIEDGTTPNP